MTALTFDTLKFARRLKEAGMDPRLAEEQAEAMAEALEVNLKPLVTEDKLESELRQLEQRLVIKLGSMLVVAVGVVVALIKLL
jgi:ferric-dicitrate binding protein FerR (iron transport regulator)